MGSAVFLYLVLYNVVYSVEGADPAGCTYFSTEKKYECSARLCSFPLDMTTFDNVPQVLHIVDMQGELAAGAPMGPTFTNFGSIVTTNFDEYIIPSLVIRCYTGGSLIMTAGALTGMSYVKEFRIKNCNILNIPDSMFTELTELNYFEIEGGSIDTFSFNSFNGLNIYAMDFNTTASLGTVAIRNSRLNDGKLPNGVLYNLPNIRHLVLENCNIGTLQSDMLQVATKLLSLTLNDNQFTSLPSKFFNNLLGLTSVDVHGIAWECTCSNAWFLDYVTANNITLHGDLVCSSPAAHLGKRLREFKIDNCPDSDVCGSVPGFAIGNYCLKAWSIGNYAVMLISLVISCVSVGLIAHSRKGLGEAGGKPAGKGAPSRPPRKTDEDNVKLTKFTKSNEEERIKKREKAIPEKQIDYNPW